MKQPELGHKLAEIRKSRNLTQEELVDLCNVSVRTIQRIEAGEVTPRVSTVKIILAALEHNIDVLQQDLHQDFNVSDFITKNILVTDTSSHSLNIMQMAWISGIVYFMTGTIEAGLEYSNWHGNFDTIGKTAYVGMKLLVFISYFLFMRGFVQLGNVFKNSLLKVSALVLIGALFVMSLLNIFMVLYSVEEKFMIYMYASESVTAGMAGLLFGIALVKFQDSMGSIAKLAGILEILIGVFFISVILFFLGFLFLIPATILEVVILYKGFEYLKSS